MNNKKKLIFIILSLSATIIACVMKITKFTHYDYNNKLSSDQKQILAKEYDIEDISDRIIAVNYKNDELCIDVGYFDTVDALLDTLDFKSDKHYDIVSERKDNFTYEYKKISGKKFDTIRIDSQKMLNTKVPCIIYIYKESNGYAYTVEKESVSNEEIFKIFE